jgi:hypothetical protein
MPPLPRLAPEQVGQLTEWIASYIDEQRSIFAKEAHPIPSELANKLQPFFPKDILSSVQVDRGRASEPPFYSELKALGIRSAPPVSDMEEITFEDVVVYVAADFGASLPRTCARGAIQKPGTPEIRGTVCTRIFDWRIIRGNSPREAGLWAGRQVCAKSVDCVFGGGRCEGVDSAE